MPYLSSEVTQVTGLDSNNNPPPLLPPRLAQKKNDSWSLDDIPECDGNSPISQFSTSIISQSEAEKSCESATIRPFQNARSPPITKSTFKTVHVASATSKGPSPIGDMDSSQTGTWHSAFGSKDFAIEVPT
ncbi:hypothetical protein Ciccas_000892 [Cichlidogyrus casuarinus]|uniref:Uncharacterized protein n=1 Tax=Cichlidogyrus casuarinus TaxID=1844966 RepID=A0ABD2QM40_9PLAT